MCQQFWDNSIQNVHSWVYIIGYMIDNLAFMQPLSGAVKCEFRRPYIRRFFSPNEHFDYGYPNSNVLL